MPYPQTSGQGRPGNPGPPGVGVASSTTRYQLSTDGNATPDGQWLLAMPSVPKGQYLWSRMDINFTNGTTATSYSVAYSAKDGSNGAPGATGPAGVGVSSSTIMYATSGASTTPPTSGWAAATPSVSKGQYLWTRTATAFTDGSSTTAYSLGYVALDGAPGTPGNPGSPGAPGINGVGIASSAVTYQTTASGTTVPTGVWSSTVPTVAKGQYLWSRTVISMTDSSTSTAYSVAYHGADGNPGTPGTAGVSYNPQTPVSRAVTVATAYQHTDVTKPYKVLVNARATQTVTLAGTVADRVELRTGPTAASVAPGGSGGFSVGVWESGITGIALMVGAAVQDGGQLSADVPAGWYFQINRLAGTSATIVSCFSQSMTS